VLVLAVAEFTAVLRETIRLAAFASHRFLQHVMGLPERDVRGDKDAPPDGRLRALKRHLELVDSSRYWVDLLEANNAAKQVRVYRGLRETVSRLAATP